MRDLRRLPILLLLGAEPPASCGAKATLGQQTIAFDGQRIRLSK